VPAGDWARKLIPVLPDDPDVPLTRALADAARALPIRAGKDKLAVTVKIVWSLR
jgi:hypothetical protein